MKKWFTLAQQGASTLQDLQKKYPQLSISELLKVLKQANGDPKKAMELLQPLMASGGGAKPGSALDLRTNPEGWFKHFDQDGNGLEQFEVAAAVAETFPGPERASVLHVVNGQWQSFDPDGSGSISLKEFLQPSGLRDCLVKALNGGASAAAPAPPAAAVAHGGGGYPAAPAAPVCEGPRCRSGCGRAPYKTFPTCCTHCKGPGGPHHSSCHMPAAGDNPSAPAAPVCEGPSCRSGCGRVPYKTFPTCCTHCKGPAGPHHSSCKSTVVSVAAVAPANDAATAATAAATAATEDEPGDAATGPGDAATAATAALVLLAIGLALSWCPVEDRSELIGRLCEKLIDMLLKNRTKL